MKGDGMSSSSSSSGGGIGFFGLLCIVFVVLKLTHYIDWSWWWVTAPIWGPLALLVIAMLTAFTVATIGAFFVAAMDVLILKRK